jgi:hypothetical protein
MYGRKPDTAGRLLAASPEITVFTSGCGRNSVFRSDREVRVAGSDEMYSSSKLAARGLGQL